MDYEIEIKCDKNRPGIYLWEIEGVGTYVGKYTRPSRPLFEYKNNVRKLLSGEPYRKSKPDGFRRIHRALAEAVRTGAAIKLTLVENAAPEELNQTERRWIKSHGTLNDA